VSIVVQVLAAAAFLLIAFSIFRFAMGLRWAKVSREAARKEAEHEGRKVVAELPLPSGDVAFLVEDATAFAWGERRVEKAGIVGLRMRLNGGVLAEWVREGVRLRAPEPTEEYEGRERWDVAVFAADGSHEIIPCGVLREGVSREVAATVFEALRRTLTGLGETALGQLSRISR
jgi:hypothetical protein